MVFGLEAIMEEDKNPVLKLTGTIVHGVGKGEYYLSKPEFNRQFERILGIKPFPGTLNVRVVSLNDQEKSQLDQQKKQHGILIHGFEKGGKHYFPGIAVHCSVIVGRTHIPALIIFPEKTVHPPEILEIISNIRILDHAFLGEIVHLEI